MSYMGTTYRFYHSCYFLHVRFPVDLCVWRSWEGKGWNRLHVTYLMMRTLRMASTISKTTLMCRCDNEWTAEVIDLAIIITSTETRCSCFNLLLLSHKISTQLDKKIQRNFQPFLLQILFRFASNKNSCTFLLTKTLEWILTYQNDYSNPLFYLWQSNWK